MLLPANNNNAMASNSMILERKIQWPRQTELEQFARYRAKKKYVYTKSALRRWLIFTILLNLALYAVKMCRKEIYFHFIYNLYTRHTHATHGQYTTYVYIYTNFNVILLFFRSAFLFFLFFLYPDYKSGGWFCWSLVYVLKECRYIDSGISMWFDEAWTWNEQRKINKKNKNILTKHIPYEASFVHLFVLCC